MSFGYGMKLDGSVGVSAVADYGTSSRTRASVRRKPDSWSSSGEDGKLAES